MKRILLGLLLFGAALPACAQSASFNVVGTTIADTQKAIREGRTTCRAVVEAYLARIRAYDQAPVDGLRLNSIVTANPDALAEADACDRDFAATRYLATAGRNRRSY